MTATAQPVPLLRPRSASLFGQVVWVTGAGRGLGRAISVACSQAGAKLAVTARTESALECLLDEVDSDPSTVIAVPCDVKDPAAVRDAAVRIAEELGPIRALINMAGINPTVSRAERLADEAWSDVIDINLSGTFFCCREAGRQMLEAGRGAIVNVSSVHGSVGIARMAAYAASKGGVETLTKALAVEWADRGVRVNCLAPGYFRTALTESYLASSRGAQVLAGIPLGRVGESDELVDAALFLADDSSSYVTGTTLTVDGGWTAQ